VSDERRRSSDGLHEDVKEISTKVTEISTMLAINFHPETGHVTRRLTSIEDAAEKLKARVESHSTDINRAKWTLGVLGFIGIGTIRGWLKQQGWIA
jgi:hypothetical protein